MFTHSFSTSFKVETSRQKYICEENVFIFAYKSKPISLLIFDNVGGWVKVATEYSVNHQHISLLQCVSYIILASVYKTNNTYQYM